MSKNFNKRLLNCTANDFMNMDREDLIKAISASEGRTVLSEVVAFVDPIPYGISNAEIVRSFGADLILYNKLDLNTLEIGGLPKCENPILLSKQYSGRLIGINLEPVENTDNLLEEKVAIPLGRQATIENFKKCKELGFDFICLTGNPGVGVSNDAIINCLKDARKYFDGMIIAGKMHGAGVGESCIDLNAIDQFIENGTDVVMIPAPGTVPGVTLEDVVQATKHIKSKGKLVMSAIGTSQEGSDIDTIKRVSLMCKMAGVDIHHIGDAGYSGVCPYENIYNLSIAVRGLRHTVRMMAIANERE